MSGGHCWRCGQDVSDTGGCVELRAEEGSLEGDCSSEAFWSHNVLYGEVTREGIIPYIENESVGKGREAFRTKLQVLDSTPEASGPDRRGKSFPVF